MTLVIPNNNKSIVSRLVSDPQVLLDVFRAAANIYSNLPDTRKEKNLVRSSFERKINMPRKNNVVGGRPGKLAGVVDMSVAGSSSSTQRSITSSRPLGISNKRNKKERIGRSPYLDRVAVCFRSNTQLVNTALNAWGYGTAIAINSAATNLSVVMPQLVALGGIYREWRCLRLDCSFIPRVGSNAAGVIAVGVDRDPRAGTPSNTATVVRKDPFFEVDIKQPGMLTWTPLVEDDRRWRYVLDASRPLEFLSHGTVVGWSNNDQALAAIIGELFFNGWFEFAIPV